MDEVEETVTEPIEEAPIIAATPELEPEEVAPPPRPADYPEWLPTCLYHPLLSDKGFEVVKTYEEYKALLNQGYKTAPWPEARSIKIREKIKEKEKELDALLEELDEALAIEEECAPKPVADQKDEPEPVDPDQQDSVDALVEQVIQKRARGRKPKAAQ